jgi:hypothetical protein
VTTSAWTVYVLTDPRTMDPRYVGCTRQTLASRLAGHHQHASTGRRVRLWTALLARDGFAPVIQAVYSADDWAAAAVLEKGAIQSYVAQGAQLLNTLHAPRGLSVGHLRLHAQCRDAEEFRRCCPTVGGSAWRGYPPFFREAFEIERVLGISAHEWLVPVHSEAA